MAGRAGLLSLGIMRSPTTGGVFASYAALADIRVAEPGATIGFAGPRVAEQTLGQTLPPTSHTAESAYEHGLVRPSFVPPPTQDCTVAVTSTLTQPSASNGTL